jgi:hypothetical protein
MKSYCPLLLVAAALFSACSSEPNSNKAPANAAAAGSNTAAANLPYGLKTGDAALNAEANTASAGNVIGPNKRRLIDVPGTTRPSLQYQPAGEDSEIASTMNAAGQMFEVRVWKRHPQLVKVESIWIDAKNKQLTYMLRSGKVLNITTDRIGNLKQATTSQLLDIAGLPQQATTPPRPGAKKEQ